MSDGAIHVQQRARVERGNLLPQQRHREGREQLGPHCKPHLAVRQVGEQ
jgi:hypothetical protein